MKKLVILLLTIIAVSSCSQKPQYGRYLQLDGNDSNICIGMDTINNNWSVEAWIRGNDTDWKETEVIVGGGEYSKLNITDKLPVIIKNGKLHNSYSGATSDKTITDKWQHIAVTCGSEGTKLYIDGEVVAQSDSVSSIIPGAIGADQGKETVFGGDIDEVRIWKCQLSQEDIKNWMNTALTAEHPKFEFIKGYYPFDEPTSDMYLNWAANGPISFHARNSRIAFYDSNFISPTVEGDNPKFIAAEGRKSLFNGVEIASEWDSPIGSKDQQIIKLRVAVSGDKGKMELSRLLLDLSKSTNLNDIEKGSLYYTGTTAKSDEKIKICDFPPSKAVDLDLSYQLHSGINYFLVTFDVSKDARLSNTLSATITSFEVDGDKFTPQKSNEFYPKQVIHANDDDSVIRVLQWNIWHGGVHTGSDGRAHIIDLIRATNADIVAMQEGYGAQERIAKELNYNLQTKSPKDNLALFSRFEIEKIETKNGFKSNPAIISLPSGKKIYVNDCWLRYAYRPEYTCYYGHQGLDTNVWIEEDKQLPTADIKQIFQEDLKPYVKDDMIQLICGDFNSCSHLDWTDRTSHLHYGYGDIEFPTSKFMYENGFTDSYRVVHPDEVTHQGGTYAVVFGHLQNSRIDFIYHKGNITPLYSKIIRTAEEIDFVWAGDHAAVFVVFK